MVARRSGGYASVYLKNDSPASTQGTRIHPRVIPEESRHRNVTNLAAAAHQSMPKRNPEEPQTNGDEVIIRSPGGSTVFRRKTAASKSAHPTPVDATKQPCMASQQTNGSEAAMPSAGNGGGGSGRVVLLCSDDDERAGAMLTRQRVRRVHTSGDQRANFNGHPQSRHSLPVSQQHSPIWSSAWGGPEEPPPHHSCQQVVEHLTTHNAPSSSPLPHSSPYPSFSSLASEVHTTTMMLRSGTAAASSRADALAGARQRSTSLASSVGYSALSSDAWNRLCYAARGELTQEDLSLVSCATLSSLLAYYGLTDPDEVAQVEAQWALYQQQHGEVDDAAQRGASLPQHNSPSGPPEEVPTNVVQQLGLADKPLHRSPSATRSVSFDRIVSISPPSAPLLTGGDHPYRNEAPLPSRAATSSSSPPRRPAAGYPKNWSARASPVSAPTSTTIGVGGKLGSPAIVALGASGPALDSAHPSVGSSPIPPLLMQPPPWDSAFFSKSGAVARALFSGAAGLRSHSQASATTHRTAPPSYSPSHLGTAASHSSTFHHCSSGLDTVLAPELQHKVKLQGKRRLMSGESGPCKSDPNIPLRPQSAHTPTGGLRSHESYGVRYARALETSTASPHHRGGDSLRRLSLAPQDNLLGGSHVK